MTWLDEALARGPLLLDGGMGTMLFRAGLKPGSSPELWNVEHPEAVRSIHLAYASAGARCITTNTFGGSRLGLARHGLEARVKELNQAAANLARDAAGPDVKVLGDVGPFGGFLEPYGEVSEGEARDSFGAQIEALAVAGVDAILVESMADPNESFLAVEAARACTSLPVFATFTFEHHAGSFKTMMGSSPAQAVSQALAAGADAAGANCGTALSLEDYLRLADELLEAAQGRPIILQPNAGPPLADGTYLAAPKAMAEWAAQAAAKGIRIVGGCCGTTPEHIEAMALVLRI